MESTLFVENPNSESAPESSETPIAVSAPSADPLVQLAQAAKAARLAPADEDRAANLLKERLTGGKADISAALAPMIDGLPWIVCVNAVSAIWEKLSAPMRRHLLSGVAKNETDPARRLNLSLARAVFKLDPPAGLKLAAAAAAGLKDPETGALTAKHRQFFFNVFIGKGKPWLLQMPLGDLKAAEADVMVHCAVESFPLCQPISQLSILRWAHGAGRLKKLTATDLDTAAKSVARWNAKLQRQLKTEIAELPPTLEAALKPEALKAEAKPAAVPESKKSKSAPKPAEKSVEVVQESAVPAVPPEELIIPGRAERLAKKATAKESSSEQERRKPEPRSESREERREENRERSREPARAFDLKEALRGVEGYVATLRSELEQAKAQLRRGEQEGKRGGRSSRAVAEPLPPAELEALTRHNARLEATVAELRGQLEDLASHHESVAESRHLHGDEPLPEGSVEQLTKLLAIKLAERYETYQAMRLEPLDKVFRLDYRDLLGSIFDTLIEAGVPLKK